MFHLDSAHKNSIGTEKYLPYLNFHVKYSYLSIAEAKMRDMHCTLIQHGRRPSIDIKSFMYKPLCKHSTIILSVGIAF